MTPGQIFLSARLVARLVAALFFCAGITPAGEADAAWTELLSQGQSALTARDFAGAEKTFQRALHEAERFGPESPRVSTTLVSLGMAYEGSKRFHDAELVYARAIAILDRGDVVRNTDFADANLRLASALVEQGKQQAAFPVLAKSMSVYAAVQGGGSLRVAEVQCLTGNAYISLKSWQQAEEPLKRCAEIREADGGVVNAALGDALYSLAIVYENEGKYNLADPRYKLAEKIREKTLGIMSPAFADVLEAHAALLKSMGHDKEAGQDAALAAVIRRHQQGNGSGRAR